MAPPKIAARAEDSIGAILGSYKLLSVIGRGGMGRVYMAEHVRLGRRVALKLLLPEYSVKRDAVARFFQEAKAVNKIRHRNIVDVTDFVELDDGTTFIIMELLEGHSLGALVRREGPLEIPRLLGVLIQVADALEAAHAEGIIHRDLKPDNIFLCRDDSGGLVVKLLDFGVAKLLTSDEDTGEIALRTAAGAVVGTPAYMAPEQAGGLEIDRRTDVYSLGAILYELSCGQPLFRARSFGEFVMKHMAEAPIPPSQTIRRAEVTPDLERVILRCVAKRPEERYQDVNSLRDDLIRLLGAYDTGTIDPRRTPFPRGSGRGTHPPFGQGSGSSVSDVGVASAERGPETNLSVGNLRAEHLTGNRSPRAIGIWATSTVAVLIAAVGLVYTIASGGDPPPSRPVLVQAPPRPAPPVAAPTPVTASSGTVTPAPAPPQVTPLAPPPRPADAPLRVTFTTTPPGAEIRAGAEGRVVCRTPCTREISVAERARAFLVHKEGFEDQFVWVDADAEVPVAPITLEPLPAPIPPKAPPPPAPSVERRRPSSPKTSPQAVERERPARPAKPPKPREIDPKQTLDPFGAGR